MEPGGTGETEETGLQENEERRLKSWREWI
jgi:hypothetical protein